MDVEGTKDDKFPLNRRKCSVYYERKKINVKIYSGKIHSFLNNLQNRVKCVLISTYDIIKFL